MTGPRRPPPPPRLPDGVPPPSVRYRVPPAAGAPIPPRQRRPARSPVIAPILAFVGLLIVGGASFWGISLLGIDVEDPALGAPTVPGSGEQTGTDGGSALASQLPDLPGIQDPADLAPAVAADLVRPPEEARPEVKGTILFTRDGDIWAASGKELGRLTTSRSDSQPTWSPDGERIYFIRTKAKTTKNSRLGGKYTLYIPDVMRMDADGRKPKAVHKSQLKDSRGLWFSHVLQPDVSPDGKTLAIVSDGPDGAGPVKLHVLPTKGGRMRSVNAPSLGELGHNDPDWGPQGERIAFTLNQARGTTGAPRIAIHTCKSKRNCAQGRTKRLKPNYANPSWSPDGSWLAVEKTTGTGRDIVIIDAGTGNERARLTTDGDSFAPTVSPDGDQVAYLHRDGLAIDVRIMTLDLTDGTITLVDDRAVTMDGRIDAASPPAWHIPSDQLVRQPAVTAPGVDEPAAADAAGGPDLGAQAP